MMRDLIKDALCPVCGRPLTIDVGGVPGYKDLAYYGCMRCNLVRHAHVQCPEIAEDEGLRKLMFMTWTEAAKKTPFIWEWLKKYGDKDFDTPDDRSISYVRFQSDRIWDRICESVQKDMETSAERCVNEERIYRQGE